MPAANPSQIQRHINGYLDHLLVERGLAKNSMSAYRRDLARYQEFLVSRGIAEFSSVTANEISEFLISLRLGSDQHPALAPSSAARTLIAVRGLHAFLAKEGITTSDSVRAVKPPGISKRLPKALSFADIEKLLAQVGVNSKGDIPVLHEGAQPHWELVKKYDIIDFELGVKITGAGFPVYKGKGAKLQRALISYFLDKNTEAGYQEFQVPYLVNEASAYGTGQLPDKEGQMYHDATDDLYLIPTAEVPVTNIFRDVILQESELPILCTGYTPCFRREAGSYGAHVRGLNRLHQFDKVEIVRIEHPDKSYEALDSMVEHVKTLLQELKLPYRILRLCGGDMGFASALTYDFEVFSTAQDKWLEISSVSNFETFQANRLKLRFNVKEGKTQLAHTLNGSSLALPRVLAGILENYQTPEGIVIPEVLRKYTGFDIIK